MSLKPVARTVAPALAPALRRYLRYAPGTIGKPFLAPAVDYGLRARPREFVTRTIFGAEFAGSTEDWIHRYLFVFGVWEPNLTAWLSERLRPGDVFVDVGANTGYFSLLAATQVGESGGVVSIEPSPSLSRRLSRNVARNKLQARVRLVNLAASDTASRVTVYRGPQGNLSATTLVGGDLLTREAEIDSQPLAQILTPFEISQARFIKIDVEGFEGPVVRGLLPVLDACRDEVEIMVEVSGSSRRAGESSAAIVSAFLQRGFHAYSIPNAYSPEAYAGARAGTERPRRADGHIDEEEVADLVFSRLDAAVL